MTTSQMQYFLTAAETLNFTAAAEQLYITQPSLSRQIANIESELGVKLFIRSNNTVTLTQAGRALHEKLSVLFKDYQSMVEEIRDVNAGSKGHLNLGVLEDQYMGDPLVDELRRLIQATPGCELNIVRYDSRTLFSRLMEGSLDAGLMLVYDEFPQFGFEYLNLDTSPAQIAINRKLPQADRTTLTLEEMNELLEEIPLAMVTQHQFPEPLQDSLKKFAPFAGLRDTSRVMILPASSSVSLYAAIGLAVTLTNRGNLLKNDPNIVMIPVEEISTITQGLVWRKGAQNPMLLQLLQGLQDRYHFKRVPDY